MTKTTRSLWAISAAGAAMVGMLAFASSAFAAAPTFAQSGYTIGVGQSTTVTTQNGVSVYMTMNSAPSIVSVSTNGSQITLTGIGLGNSSLTFCEVGTALNCTNLGVIVQATAVTSVSLSSSNVSLSVGGNQAITISGGNGSYSISSNSNTSAVSTSLSGTNLTVSGLAAGSATISVCDTSNSCASLSVTVSSATSSGLAFSQNNFSLTSGSSQVVTVSGGNGVYSVSSNSNSAVATAGISGNISNSLVVTAGTTAGSDSINVCDSANVCGTLSVAVSAPATNQIISFNPSSPSLAVGQTINVTLTNTVNATAYMVLTNKSAGIAQASISNNTVLSLTGVSAGTDLLVICTVGGGGCNQLNVTVTGTAASTPTTTTTPVVTTTAPATTATTVTQSNAVASSQVVAQIKNIAALLAQALSQIQSAQSQLNQLESQINAGGISGVSASSNSSSGDFTEYLGVGSEDSQVTALQNKLTALGFYSGPVTGYFGPLTKEGVIKYQTARGITADGSLDASTRTSLNSE